MASNYRLQLDDFLKTLQIVCDKVLDVGGSARPVKTRVGTWDVKDYKILDNELERKYQEKWNEAHYKVDIQEDIDYLNIKDVDIIFCLEVFEYLYSPYKALENIYKILKKGGVAYISTSSLYPVHQPVDYDSTRFTKQGFKRAASRIGFEVLDCITRTMNKVSNQLILKAWILDGMRPAKHYDHNQSGHIFILKK
jgi:SAM-dependent methyltransferase